MTESEPITFNYSTIVPGIFYEGLLLQGSTNVLVAFDRRVKRPDLKEIVVVVGLYERGTFNQLDENRLPVTHMTMVTDEASIKEITDLIRKENMGVYNMCRFDLCNLCD